MSPLPAALSWLNLPMALVVPLVGAGQLAAWAFFHLRLRRDAPEPALPEAPAVAVVVPCKGEVPLRNVDTLLAQDYPGPLEILYVAPSTTDPAFRRLSARFESGRQGRARVLSSGAAPSTCGEAMLNCIHGARSASPSSSLLLFIDSDLAVRPDWARRLAAAFADPETAVATSMMVSVPSAGGVWPFLRMLWLGLMLPFFNLRPGVSGHSCAIRRRDFEEWGVARTWSRSITTDSPLSALARARGKSIRYVPLAAPSGSGPCDRASFFRVFDKWTVYLRLYAPRDWALSGLFILGKAWLYLRAARMASAPRHLGLLLAADVLYGVLVFLSLRRALPGPFGGLGPGKILAAGLAAPLVQAVYFVNVLRSLRLKDIVWGGYTYRVRAPYDIEVVRRA